MFVNGKRCESLGADVELLEGVFRTEESGSFSGSLTSNGRHFVAEWMKRAVVLIEMVRDFLSSCYQLVSNGRGRFR